MEKLKQRYSEIGLGKTLVLSGIGVFILGQLPLVLIISCVNLFAPELITDSILVDSDPYTPIGGWISIVSVYLGFLLIGAGWVINGHHKDKEKSQNVRVIWQSVRVLLGLLLLVSAYFISFILALLIASALGR